jgi:hypothetical protein
MIMGMATAETEAGILPTAEQFAAMQKYNEELVNAGVLLAAEGLSPTSMGARVEFDGDTCTVIDGPFTESKELIAGFIIIEAASLDEAIEWARRGPNMAPDGKSKVYVRKLMGIEDFGDDFTPSEKIAEVKY